MWPPCHSLVLVGCSELNRAGLFSGVQTNAGVAILHTGMQLAAEQKDTG